MSVIIERPPESRRIQTAKAIVSDDQSTITDPQGSHRLGKLFRPHDVERPFFFFQVVMSPKGDGARNMGTTVGVAVIAIDNPKIRIV